MCDNYLQHKRQYFWIQAMKDWDTKVQIKSIDQFYKLRCGNYFYIMSLNTKTKSSINQLGQLFTEITNAPTCNRHFRWILTKQSKLQKNVRCPHPTEFKWILKILYWTILTCMTSNLLHNHHSQTPAMWTKSGISFIAIVSYSQCSVIFCTETI